MLFRTRPALSAAPKIATATATASWVGAVVVTALVGLGCSRTEAPAPTGGPAPGEPTTERAVAVADTETLPEDATQGAAPVLARVGDRAITADEVAAEVDRIRHEHRTAPDPKLVRGVLDALIADAVVAAEARAEGFGDSAAAQQAADSALAALYLDARTRAEAEAAVTDDDVVRYYGAHRRAGKLVVASREEAVTLQTALTEAIATTPERHAGIFADFRGKQGLDPGDADLGATALFDRTGRGLLGETITAERVAGAAFALKAVGAVSPPVPLPDGRWALVQLLEIAAEVAPDALTAEQKDEARAALVTARAVAARNAIVARLRRDAAVSVDEARVTDLAAALTKAEPLQRGMRLRRFPIDAMQIRRDRMRRLPKQTRLPELSVDAEQIRRATPEEIQRKMHPPAPGDATP